MSTDSAYQNPSVSEIDIDGDADSTSFTYYGIDYYYNESVKDKVVVVGGLEVNGGAGDDYGVVAVLSNAENIDVTKVYTEDFRINEEHSGGYYAVAIRNGDSFYIGGSYEILNSDYYGYETLELDVENVPPIANDFKVDYASVDYASARTHAQVEPTGTNPIAIWIDVTDPNSVSEITEVTLQAWHDGESGSPITWPSNPTDANGVVNITYNVASDEFTLNYPTTNEVTLGLGSATQVDDTTLRIKFVFVPGKQARYGLDGGGTAGDDACTWNVRFECNDTTNNITKHGDWEFGYTKVTSLGGVVTAQVTNPIAPGAGDGNSDVTNTLTIIWSSNWKYKVSVEMTSTLYYAGGPDTIPDSNVLVYEASSWTSGYAPNDFTSSNNDQGQVDYYGFNHGNPIYWYGSGGGYSATAPPTGNEQTFMTHFKIYVEYGTMAGSYTANLQYVVDIA
jgi:hypothetical protein